MNLSNVLLSTIIISTLILSAFGADKALIIGIDNYQNPNVSRVEGGVADARAMERFIQEKFGFKLKDIRTLTESQATTFNIRDSVKNWLIKDSKAGDRVFFFYSGHGARVLDQDGDEDDKRDEVIAPFDIDLIIQGDKVIPRNFIRDDEINEWIAALSNRQLVMVFDSCNSGTLSRSDGKPTKFLNLETLPTTSRSSSDEQWSPKSKDLTTIIDTYLDKKTPNAVVISASQPNQTAAWFDTNGSLCNQSSATAKYRGALAYLFEKAYQNGNPTLSQLNSFLTIEMQKLQENKMMCKTNSDFQKPLLEFSAPKANQTLWGMDSTNRVKPNLESPVIASLQNPLSKMQVGLNFNSHNNSYKIDDAIKYSVTVSEDAYLYVVVFSENNVATLPNSSDQIFLQKGKISNLSATAGEPLGKDVWVVIAAKQKIAGLENLPKDQQFTWDEIYKKIGIDELQSEIEIVAKTRGAGSAKMQPSEWQTASVVMTTLPK